MDPRGPRHQLAILLRQDDASFKGNLPLYQFQHANPQLIQGELNVQGFVRFQDHAQVTGFLGRGFRGMSGTGLGVSP